ncbi:MAG: Transcription antitermination protein NusB [Chroococcopsis gigantea SAG 12.99]|jgi:N utilization substance protein B|nr:transcription antitermination protein NusB [Chlorogloea purpurea SAG 13.99]MDV3000412.1 Transcription antitermination protein NusB [Chroococcopsis gigantea SAG 12.99]
MPPSKDPRTIARELALLSLSQIKGTPENLEQQDINSFILAAIRTLTSEAQENLETAATEINRGNERLLASDTKTTNLRSAQTMVKEALELAQSAINRVGLAMELPETVHQSEQYMVRSYAIEIIAAIHRRRSEIEEYLNEALVNWQLRRLVRIDQDILRIALADILYLDIPHKVAIDEAVKLAKRYSDEDGYRFINGVLRRVTDNLKQKEGVKS